jgi:transposase
MARGVGGGRPRKQDNIDKKTFEGLCGIQCTEEEIANFFGVSHDTISRWCKKTYKKNFDEIFSEKRSTGKVSLRRAQWRQAEKNPTMAIWLGKQYLGQKDETTVNQKFAPIVFEGEGELQD